MLVARCYCVKYHKKLPISAFFFNNLGGLVPIFDPRAPNKYTYFFNFYYLSWKKYKEKRTSHALPLASDIKVIAAKHFHSIYGSQSTLFEGCGPPPQYAKSRLRNWYFWMGRLYYECTNEFLCGYIDNKMLLPNLSWKWQILLYF